MRDHYYRQAIQARRTLDLIPLCLEWMSEFPPPKPSSNPQPQFEMTARRIKGTAVLHHHVYVIELDRAVLKEKRFLGENPDYAGEKACLYVGSTGLTPEERFKNHQAGIKSGKYPHKFGQWLRPRLYQKYNPMTYEDAAALEKQLALELRANGYAVWQR